VTGGAGDDRLVLSGGGYAATGGDGADRIEIGDAQAVAVRAGAGDTVVGGTGGQSSHVSLTDDAVFQGGDGAETVVNRSTGAVATGAGNDSVYGFGGASSVSGGAGDDRLVGSVSPSAFDASQNSSLSEFTSTDADTLDGGAGDDAIRGSAGDLITGGEGVDDITLYLDADEDLAGAVVTDFDPATEQMLIYHDSFGTTPAAPLVGEVSVTETPAGDTVIAGRDGQVLATLRGVTGVSVGLQTSDAAPLTDLQGNPTPTASYDVLVTRFFEVTT
jgi:Ca2+-binding RTX toxin-like protein